MKKIYLIVSFLGSSLNLFAMLYSNGTGTSHNTTYVDNISEIWNRTIYLDAGTGVYLGKQGETYWMITANHISTSLNSVGKIVDINNSVHELICKESYIVSNDSRYSQNEGYLENADLKLVSFTTSDSFFEEYADKINIYTGAISTTSNSFFQSITAKELYTVGTGKSSNLNEYVDKGNREKQWANFKADILNNNVVRIGVPQNTQNTYSICYQETFSTSEISYQGTEQDSGSGVFIYENQEWSLVGINAYVIVDKETGIQNNSKTCFIDLSAYSTQINNIMNEYSVIPEPDYFGFYFTGLLFAILAPRRHRK